MGDITNLRLILQQIKEDKYRVPTDLNITDIVFEMLRHIGNPDPDLRDELIYSILLNWIIYDNVIDDKLKEILDVVMDDNHLFYRIGENNTDSVFTRSFSALVVPLIIYRHRKQKLFNEEELINIFKKITRYFIEEKDLRGYVEGNGWAHSVAHTADALDELAMCNEIGYKELLYLLEIIQAKVCIGTKVYINEEDERLVTAIISILDRNLLSIEEVSRWIKSYSEIKDTGTYMNDYNMKINIKNFLRSMYFRILNKDGFEEIVEKLKDTLNDISNYN